MLKILNIKIINKKICQINKVSNINTIIKYSFSNTNINDSYQQKPFNQQYVTRKDNIFTISLIGRPNVGKSSLFNKLTQGNHAITDSMPGLTRDRREVISHILGYPLRIIDTAGLESEEGYQTKTNSHSKRTKELLEGNKQLRQKMYDSTIQAMLYSDLAVFIIDSQQGITTQDFQLAKFLQKKVIAQNKKIEKQIKYLEENKEQADNQLVIMQQQNVLKTMKQQLLLVANKCDIEEYQDEIINDVYKLGLGEPLFISCEGGDGLTDLLSQISKLVPESYRDEYENKRISRMEKHVQLRKQLKSEVEDLIISGKVDGDFDIRSWEYEFDLANQNPEENSDLDTDSEIDPKQIFSMGVVPNSLHSDNYFSKKPIQISIVGRANCGKSTLTNALLEEDRVIVDDLEGTTRDSIKHQWNYKGRKINLIDTAGIDKKMKHKSLVDQKCYESTIQSIKYSNVVICMIDALRAFQVQDLAVAQYISEEGRGLIILVNKWDLVPAQYKKKCVKFMQKQLENKLSQVKDISVICISAKEKENLDSVMEEVIKVNERYNVRITTGVLNDWLNRLKKTQNSPTSEGEILKIRFVSQIKTRPPTFAAFVNDKSLFKMNYLRYFRAALTEEFQLQGIPIRVIIRDTQFKKTQKKFREQNNGDSLKSFLREKRKVGVIKKTLGQL